MAPSVARYVSGPLFPWLVLSIPLKDKVAFLQTITVRVVLPEIVPELAVMIVVPAVTAVARPLLLTVATWVSDEVQVTGIV